MFLLDSDSGLHVSDVTEALAAAGDVDSDDAVSAPFARPSRTCCEEREGDLGPGPMDRERVAWQLERARLASELKARKGPRGSRPACARPMRARGTTLRIGTARRTLATRRLLSCRCGCSGCCTANGGCGAECCSTVTVRNSLGLQHHPAYHSPSSSALSNREQICPLILMKLGVGKAI
jgi:hypothetical protein